MRTATAVATGPGFGIATVTCSDDHRGWSPVELRTGNTLVLARRGRFRRSAGGVVVDVDPTVGYVGRPSDEERFAHPSGGDVCTAVSVSDDLWGSLAGDGPVESAVYVGAELDLAHRLLVRTARRGDVAFGLAERLVMLVSAAVRRVADGSDPRPSDRALADAARAAIVADHPAAGGLMPLAELLGASPFRLSRVFSREMGVSLTRYRNRVRVGRALDRLEAGDTDGGRLAAELGFADQAHLCRTVREHVGHTPTSVRRLLNSGGEAGLGPSDDSHPVGGAGSAVAVGAADAVGSARDAGGLAATVGTGRCAGSSASGGSARATGSAGGGGSADAANSAAAGGSARRGGGLRAGAGEKGDRPW